MRSLLSPKRVSNLRFPFVSRGKCAEPRFCGSQGQNAPRCSRATTWARFCLCCSLQRSMIFRQPRRSAGRPAIGDFYPCVLRAQTTNLRNGKGRARTVRDADWLQLYTLIFLRSRLLSGIPITRVMDRANFEALVEIRLQIRVNSPLRIRVNERGTSRQTESDSGPKAFGKTI